MRRVPRIPLICAYEPCQTPFEVLPWRQYTAKYCSRSCTLRGRPKPSLADHFWAKVAKGASDECWLWHGAIAGGGYGTIYVLEHRRPIGAHVVSYFLHFGTWPPEGMYVLHNCPVGDQPACQNPAHLWLGTPHDNVQYMLAKDRGNFPRKVSQEQAVEIYALYATGQWTHKQLAIRYEVSRAGITWIIKQYMNEMALQGVTLPVLPTHRERAARGERSANAKLTDVQWQEALTLYSTGKWNIRALAKRYGVNRTSIRNRLKHQL